MRQYPFADTKINRILLGVFLTALLYLSRDTLLTTSVIGFERSQFLMLGLLTLAGLVFLIYNRRHWKEILTDKRVGLLLIAAAVFLLPMVLKRDWQMMYLSVLLCLFAGVFFSFFTSMEEAAKYLVVILTAMGTFSVIATYGLRLLPDNGIVKMPVFANSKGVEFYNFGVSYVSVDYVSNRNFGIFREPGVYQYFIVLAMFLNNYAVSWKKERSLWIVNCLLIVQMLSTLALGGFVETALLAVILFFDKKLYRNKYVCIVLTASAAALTAVVLWAYAEKNMLWWEIYAMTVCKFAPGESSGSDRINSILLNLRFFLDNPLLGSRVSEVLHAMENNTFSTGLMFSIFGIGGGALHAAGWLALVDSTGRKLWVKLGLLLVLFMSFNTQNLIADLFFWLLPIMALTERLGGRKRHGA